HPRIAASCQRPNRTIGARTASVRSSRRRRRRNRSGSRSAGVGRKKTEWPCSDAPAASTPPPLARGPTASMVAVLRSIAIVGSPLHLAVHLAPQDIPDVLVQGGEG